MSNSSLSVPVSVAAAGRAASAWHGAHGAIVPRLIAGLALMALWEVVVRGLAPAYVAKPTTVALAIPHVLERNVDEQLGLRARNEDRRRDAQGQAVELALPGDIGDRLARSPSGKKRFDRGASGGTDFTFRAGCERGVVQLKRMADENSRLGARQSARAQQRFDARHGDG